MWHEARKQEKMIRGMIVDYRRRAERRKDFYEKIKAEPTQFLQLHGRQCKIHLDPAIAAAGDSPSIMMPWQGDSNNLIDRFDARAHLDYIPEIKVPDIPPEELSPEERQCNYERYRILAQNVFLGIGEDKFLQQLAIEEQFGVTIEEKETQKEKLHEKKGQGAAIGYNYSDPTAQPSCSTGPPDVNKAKADDESDDDSDLEIIDVDLSIDVNKMEASQAHELNAVGPQFGMAGCDLFSFLTGDADDAEHQKQLIRDEKEKAMFSGRKSRRERRAHRDKKLATRVLSPPSYAAPSEGGAAPRSPSPPSRSPSPAPPDRIQFITSFGGDDEPAAGAAAASASYGKSLYADKVKHNLKRVETYSEVTRGFKYTRRSPYPDERDKRYKHYGQSWRGRRSRSPRRSRSRHSRSRSRSRSRSYSPRRRRSRSRSRSRPRNYTNRSVSPMSSNHGSGYARHNDSRSMSYESEKAGASVGGAAPLPRYYGRRKEDKESSSELDLDSDSSEERTENTTSVGANANANPSQLRLTGSSSKGPSRETLTLKMRLKRKMQAQLSKQLRADKRAEAERQERESRRQARRDEEMRELAIKLRRKQREMRHQQNMRSSDDSDRSRSPSSSRGSQERESRLKSRSASNSPSKEIGPVSSLNDNPDSASSISKNYDVQDNKSRPYVSERYKDKNIGERNEHLRNCSSRYTRSDRYRGQEESLETKKYDSSQSGNFERWEEDRNEPGKRPYPSRGAYRSAGRRYGAPDVEQGCEGPPHWQADSYDGQSDRRRHEKEPAAVQAKNRVKLVDY